MDTLAEQPRARTDRLDFLKPNIRPRFENSKKVSYITGVRPNPRKIPEPTANRILKYIEDHPEDKDDILKICNGAGISPKFVTYTKDNFKRGKDGKVILIEDAELIAKQKGK